MYFITIRVFLLHTLVTLCFCIVYLLVQKVHHPPPYERDECAWIATEIDTTYSRMTYDKETPQGNPQHPVFTDIRIHDIRRQMTVNSGNQNWMRLKRGLSTTSAPAHLSTFSVNIESFLDLNDLNPQHDWSQQGNLHVDSAGDTNHLDGGAHATDSLIHHISSTGHPTGHLGQSFGNIDHLPAIQDQSPHSRGHPIGNGKPDRSSGSPNHQPGVHGGKFSPTVSPRLDKSIIPHLKLRPLVSKFFRSREKIKHINRQAIGSRENHVSTTTHVPESIQITQANTPYITKELQPHGIDILDEALALDNEPVTSYMPLTLDNQPVTPHAIVGLNIESITPFNVLNYIYESEEKQQFPSWYNDVKMALKVKAALKQRRLLNETDSREIKMINRMSHEHEAHKSDDSRVSGVVNRVNVKPENSSGVGSLDPKAHPHDSYQVLVDNTSYNDDDMTYKSSNTEKDNTFPTKDITDDWADKSAQKKQPNQVDTEKKRYVRTQKDNTLSIENPRYAKPSLIALGHVFSNEPRSSIHSNHVIVPRPSVWDSSEENVHVESDENDRGWSSESSEGDRVLPGQVNQRLHVNYGDSSNRQYVLDNRSRENSNRGHRGHRRVMSNIEGREAEEEDDFQKMMALLSARHLIEHDDDFGFDQDYWTDNSPNSPVDPFSEGFDTTADFDDYPEEVGTNSQDVDEYTTEQSLENAIIKPDQHVSRDVNEVQTLPDMDKGKQKADDGQPAIPEAVQTVIDMLPMAMHSDGAARLSENIYTGKFPKMQKSLMRLSEPRLIYKSGPQQTAQHVLGSYFEVLPQLHPVPLRHEPNFVRPEHRTFLANPYARRRWAKRGPMYYSSAGPMSGQQLVPVQELRSSQQPILMEPRRTYMYENIPNRLDESLVTYPYQTRPVESLARYPIASRYVPPEAGYRMTNYPTYPRVYRNNGLSWPGRPRLDNTGYRSTNAGYNTAVRRYRDPYGEKHGLMTDRDSIYSGRRSNIVPQGLFRRDRQARYRW